MAWLVPPQYLAIDIETIAGDPCEAEEWMRKKWSPNPNWKPATIGSRFLEAYEKKKEQLALLDTAPIISVAMRTEADIRVIHWLPVEESQIAGAGMERCENQVAMLRRVRDYLDQCTPETVLIGHNILHFDLPKLRRGMIRYGVRLPQCLVDREQPVFDTMLEWNRYTLDERPMVSLSDVLEACGVPNHKQIVEGGHIHELYTKRDYAAILTYAVADVVAEWTLFLLMTGQGTDRETRMCDSDTQARATQVTESDASSTMSERNAVVQGPEADEELHSLIEEFQK